jgi:hypothetical protein
MTLNHDSQQVPLPAAVFVGDFNTGKSLLINALIRNNLLFTSREESLVPPVFISRGIGTEPICAGRPPGEQSPIPKSHVQFLGIRQLDEQPCECEALAAMIPDFPFRHFVLVDTPGASSEKNKSDIFPVYKALENTLFIVTTTLDYWPARHTMALIKEYHFRFPGRFVVVANMADQENADEIRRVRDKARRRMENNGIRPAPPFFALSARLELTRRGPEDEYRNRIKKEVRELCDAGFDAFRVLLYEFEASVARHIPDYDIEALFSSTLAAAVVADQKGQTS